jgi:hypothetical protein
MSRKKADIAFSKYIRLRDGTRRAQASENCSGSSMLQCAHVLSRSYGAIRVNPENAVALCASCHVFYTHRPIEWELWCRENLGDGTYDRLRSLALTHERPDWKHEASHWAKAVEELV